MMKRQSQRPRNTIWLNFLRYPIPVEQQDTTTYYYGRRIYPVQSKKPQK